MNRLNSGRTLKSRVDRRPCDEAEVSSGHRVLNGLLARVLPAIVLAAGAALCQAAEPNRLPVIGQLYFGDPTAANPSDQAFREGLLELGYVDGKNITILPLYANGREEQIPVLVEHLVAKPVDVMFVSIKAVRAAMQATKSIPIVCPYIGDPIRDGLVKSLSHPGANFTGISGQSWETDSKRLELARELRPGLKRIGVLYDANFPDDVISFEQLRDLARQHGITIHLLGV
ncbi:MAG: ABC transporter substrate-binding protein, partial [Betaproteobacteria bacterium]